jgi:hypothetical protein
MPNHDFEATPTLNTNGKVSWKLCYINPPDPPKCGTTKADYPNIELVQDSGKNTIKFVITGDQTNLGIKFANDPLWIKKGSQPTGPVVNGQIESLKGHGTPELTFVDKNSKPDKADPSPYVLKYRLNFIDKDNNKVTSIDPDIKNGGTTAGFNQTAVLLAGAGLLLLLAAIVMSIRAIRRQRQSNPGGRP